MDQMRDFEMKSRKAKLYSPAKLSSSLGYKR
jgi:hypothetical protein